MAISSEDLERMEESLASPEAVVQDGRRRIERRSVSETIEALHFARGKASAAAGKRRVKRVKPVLGID